MSSAVRRLIRMGLFAFLSVLRRLERTARRVLYATFTSHELDSLAVGEWEAFGAVGGPVFGDGLFPWEVELFKKQIRPGDSLLVVGAGNGRDVLPLLEAGHSVVAIDIAPGALDVLKYRASERRLDVRTIQASIVQLDLGPELFDVILFSWFTLGYLRGAHARSTALANSRKALAPGGRILLSYIPGSVAIESTRAHSLLDTAARMFGGSTMEDGDHVNVSGTAARPAVFYSHTFKPSDIEDEMRRLGFEVLLHDHPTNGVGVLALRPAIDGQNR